MTAGSNKEEPTLIDDMSSEVSDALRSRSVNDFDTEYALRRALRNGKRRTSFASWAIPDQMQLQNVTEELGFGNDDTFDDGGNEDDDFDSDLEDMLDNEHDPTLDWVISNLDKETSVEQSLDEELARLQVLRSYLIMDSERESNFERLTALAGRMFDVPIALISLVDLGRQWFMSNRGLGDVRETPRKLAFCAHAILSTQDLLIVPDATKDPRFYDSALVTGPPNIRFYAGAPLISPEGVKLGTFCIIDSRTRPDGLSLPEKQNLRELAAMVMDAMVDRRSQKKNNVEDKSKQIACTAHDLLTPLSGVQMSVSLLQEDTQLMNHLDVHQKELIDTAANCSDMMSRICHETIETFRGDVHQTKQDTQARRVSPGGEDAAAVKDGGKGDNGGAVTSRQLKTGQKAIHLASLVKNITMVMDPYPKKVPLYITIDPMLPKEFISNDLKVFRSLINYLTNACKHTQRGCVHLKIFKIEKKAKGKKNKVSKKPGKMSIMFEVEDTGKGVPLEQYSSLFRPFRDDEMGENGTSDNCIAVDADGNVVPGGGMCTPEMETPGLGLYSVATNVGSIGGEYGFRPREVARDEENENLKSGSVFWFSIPLLEPLVSEQLKQQQQQQGSAITPPTAPAVSNGAGTNSFKNETVEESIKQYHSQSSTTRRKVIVCDHLPEDAMRVPRVSVLKNGRKARRLCAGSWNDDNLVKSSNIVSVSNSAPAAESPMSVNLDLPTSGSRISDAGNSVAASSSAEPGKFKVLSTSNLTDTDAKDLYEMVASVYEDNKNKKPNDGDMDVPSPEKAKPMPIRAPSLSALNPNAPRKKRALVIDDSLVIRKSIGRALSTMGFDVTQATNGMEGLHELQSSVFDVVLCDFLMPIMDGLDCVQQYRSWEESHRPTLKQYIIGISAHANPRDIERGIACGMSSFLSKPLPIKVLRELKGSKDLTDMSKKLDEMNTTHDIPLLLEEGDLTMMVTDDAPDMLDEANGDGGVGKPQRQAGGGGVKSTLRRRISQQERDEESNTPICLIAEDSKTVAKVVIRAIEGRGWRTSWAENGEEALRLLKTRNWDAVFLDDEMPRMNGTQCLERFRAWEKENRVATQKHVIFMSGNYIPPPPGAETSCAAFPKGFDGAVGKPVVLKDLYSLLSTAAEEGKDEKKSSDIMHR